MLSSALAFFPFSVLVLHPVANEWTADLWSHCHSHLDRGGWRACGGTLQHQTPGGRAEPSCRGWGLFEFADKPCASAAPSSSGLEVFRPFAGEVARRGPDWPPSSYSLHPVPPCKRVAIVWRNLQPQLIRTADRPFGINGCSPEIHAPGGESDDRSICGDGWRENGGSARVPLGLS